MKFIAKPAGVYQANCYIVYDEKTMKGFIIDPGGDEEDILNILRNNGITAEFIILTHGHFDHTGAVNKLKRGLNIPVYMNEKDLCFVSGDSNIKRLPPYSENIAIDKLISDGDSLEYGNETLKIIETPGHTMGSISIFTCGCLFTGDTLFAGSVGRTDLVGGSQVALEKSIKSKLMVFPDETRVYPGHGPSTTIGCQKIENPYI